MPLTLFGYHEDEALCALVCLPCYNNQIHTNIDRASVSHNGSERIRTNTPNANNSDTIDLSSSKDSKCHDQVDQGNAGPIHQTDAEGWQILSTTSADSETGTGTVHSQATQQAAALVITQAMRFYKDRVCYLYYKSVILRWIIKIQCRIRIFLAKHVCEVMGTWTDRDSFADVVNVVTSITDSKDGQKTTGEKNDDEGNTIRSNPKKIPTTLPSSSTPSAGLGGSEQSLNISQSGRGRTVSWDDKDVLLQAANQYGDDRGDDKNTIEGLDASKSGGGKTAASNPALREAQALLAQSRSKELKTEKNESSGVLSVSPGAVFALSHSPMGQSILGT